MKRYILLAILNLIAIALTACGSQNKNQTKTTGVLPTTPTEKVSAEEIKSLSEAINGHAWCALQDGQYERIAFGPSGDANLDISSVASSFGQAESRHEDGTWSLKGKQLDLKLGKRKIRATVELSGAALAVRFLGAAAPVSYSNCDE